MFVSKSMTTQVITIDPEAGIFEAQERMAAHDIRHLPVVVEGNRLVGIITDRDLRSVLPYSLFKDPGNLDERAKVGALKVKDVMTRNPKTIGPAHTIQDALLLVQKEKVGAFPVVDENGTLTGILSVRDLLRAFINVLGIGEPGTLLGILVEEKVGQLKRIVDAITEENVSFGSVLVARYWDEGKRAVFPYLRTLNVNKVKKKLESMGYQILDPMEWYMDRIPKKK